MTESDLPKVTLAMTDQQMLRENDKAVAMIRNRMLHVAELPRLLQRPARAVLRLFLSYFLVVRREGIYRG